MNRTILHVDMNSYFATVEQHCNPFLRGKPIAIGGSHGTRSIVVAASIEAKRYGVKTGMNHAEAKSCCPQIMFIKGDPAKYAEITQQFIDLARKHTSRIEVYSIDELFMDLTGWIKTDQDAINIAKKLKADLKEYVADYITCSVGIAPNRMLAKVASNMKKPDGLVLLREKDVPFLLQWIDLTDIFGIGDRLKVRLFDLGITTLEQLGKYPVESLQQHFGPNNGVMMSEMGRGIDHTEIPYIDEVEQAKTIGHTYTLSKNTKSKDMIYAHLLRLAEKVGRRLRKDEYQARYIWAYLRWADMSGRHEGVTLKHYVNDGYEVYTIARSIIDRWYLPQPVRLIGVGTSLLLKDGLQLPMIEYKVQQDAMLEAQDRINDRFGEFTIQRARSMGARLTTKVGGFKEPHQFS